MLAAAFLAALGIRVLFLAQFRGNYDVDSYGQVVEILRRGGDVYRETNRYNYSPVWAYVVRAVSAAAQASGVSFGVGVGAFLLAVDLATAWLLYRLAGRGRRGAGAAALFFLNPVSVFASSFHLQFDNLAILFLLAAVAASRREPLRRVPVVLALSVSLLVKHIAAFFPPLFARGRKGVGWAALAPYLIFALSFLPFVGSWSGIRANVFQYRSLNEDFGVAMLWHVRWLPAWLPQALFVAASAAAVVALRRLETARACLQLFLVTLIFLPGICQYYLVWPIALASLYGGAGYFLYSVVVAITFFGSPDGLGMPLTHLPGWHGIWWSLVFWLAWEQRQRDILRIR